MGFNRTLVSKDGKLPQPMRAGAGLLANFAIDNRAAEADETLSIENISGGVIQQGTTLTSDVIYTLPTAANILASGTLFDTMDIGDAYSFVVTNAQAGAFDVVIAVGAGITAVGANNTLSVPPQASRIFNLVKTAAATFDLY
jgi:hypothetical protein